VWKLTPSHPSRDRSALTAALKPLAVDGTIISFSAFSWAVRPPGQDDRNQARKERVSRTPEIKMGDLLGRSPAAKQAFVTWAWVVVPSGLSLRGPDMLLDMRLLTVSGETAVSDGSDSMAVGLSDPLGWNGATGPAKAAAYVTPPSGGTSCRLHVAACSPVAEEVAGRGADPAVGAGRLLAGSDESPELRII
jgi:hypothetical protein